MYRTLSVILLCLFVAGAHALAEEPRAPEWKISLALGQGVIENPLKGREDGNTYLLPTFSYYGDRFFVSNLTAGYSLLEEKNYYVDLIVRPNEDGLYFNLDDAEYTMASLSSFLGNVGGVREDGLGQIERRISAMAGPSATIVTAPVDVSFSYLHDISRVHNGTEASLSLDKSYPLFGGGIGWSFGATQKDMDVVDYYYHLRRSEAGRFASQYRRAIPPTDVTDYYARLHFSYPLGKGLELRLAAKYNHLDMDGRNPLMIGKPETLSWFAGLQYSIGSGQ